MNDKILDKLWLKRHPKDKLFLRLIKGCRIEDTNDYLYYVNKNNIILMKYYKIHNIIYLHHDLIWNEFHKKFDDDNIEQILFDMVNTHTPFSITSVDDVREL